MKLNKAELRLAEYIGKMRNKTNRDHGIPNTLIGTKLSHIDYETLGMAAELVVCRDLNVYPDLTLEPRSGGSDLVFDYYGQSMTADVKHTIYANGKLLVSANKRPEDADIYILVVGELPDLDIVGWAYAKEVMTDRNWQRFPEHGSGWHVPQSELRKWINE